MNGAPEPPDRNGMLREMFFPRGFSARRWLALCSQAGFAAGEAEAEKRYREAAWFDTQPGDLFRARARLWHCAPQGVWEWQGKGGGCLHLEEAGEGGAAEPRLPPEAAALVAGRRLLLHLRARVREEVYRLRDGQGGEIKVGFARWTFLDPHQPRRRQAGPRTLWWRGSEEDDARFRAAFALAGLAPLPFDPLEAGLRALGRPLPGAPVPEELRLQPADHLAAAGRKILGRQAYKMEANTEGTLLDLDPEYLHDLRVATRRARFALRLLGPLYGAERCERLREELRWIAGLLGEVRDLDVFGEQIRLDLERAQIDPGEAAWVASALDRQREAARQALLPGLRSERFAALAGALFGIEPLPAEPGAIEPEERPLLPGTPAEEAARPMIEAAVRRVRRWRKRELSALAAEDLHRLRIHFKRLRYTAEYFADLFGEEYKKAIRGLVPFQDCLGAHQDAVVALSRLQGLWAQRPDLSPPAILAFGALLQVQRERALAQRALFAERWPAFPRLAKKLLP